MAKSEKQFDFCFVEKKTLALGKHISLLKDK